MPTKIPTLGHIGNVRKVEVNDPIERATYLARGRHLLMGQRRKRGDTGALLLLGKCIEQTRVSNKFDTNVWLDIRTPHVVFVCGRRGTGKSYDLGILAEGLSLSQESKITTKDPPITTVFFDTQSQFWALLEKPDDRLEQDKEQLDQLSQWDIPPNGIPAAQLFAPSGDSTGHRKVSEFAIDPAELDLEDWCGLFDLDIYSPQGQLIRNLLRKVATDGYSISQGPSSGSSQRVQPQVEYELNDLIACLQGDVEVNEQSQRQTRDAVLWKLEALRDSQVFQKGGIDVHEVLQPGRLSIFLLRNLDDATKSLVVSVISKKIFRIMGRYHTERKAAERAASSMSSELSGLPPGVWMLIDEAHLICPSSAHTAAKSILIDYVKRGRDAGLSLVLATQQPSAVDSRVVSQIDLLIAHRLVVDADISAALARVPADFPKQVSFGGARISDRLGLIRALDTGEAWVADAETNRAILVAMRPRVSAHGGDEPKVV